MAPSNRAELPSTPCADTTQDTMTYGTSGTRYLEADVLGRPKEWLVPLLYEHLLANLRRAHVQITVGDVAGKSASFEKANAIVLELLSSLDMERGGELARNLSSLYAFLAGEIMSTARSMDTVRLDRIVAMVAELHDAWTGAAEAVAPRGRSATQTLGANLA